MLGLTVLLGIETLIVTWSSQQHIFGNVFDRRMNMLIILSQFDGQTGRVISTLEDGLEACLQVAMEFEEVLSTCITCGYKVLQVYNMFVSQHKCCELCIATSLQHGQVNRMSVSIDWWGSRITTCALKNHNFIKAVMRSRQKYIQKSYVCEKLVD